MGVLSRYLSGTWFNGAVLGRLAVLAAFIGASATSVASLDGERTWTFLAGPGHGYAILGSKDTRQGWWVAVQRSMPEKRFTLRGRQGEFVLEFGYNSTRGGGLEGIPENRTHGFSLLGLARWPFAVRGSVTGFVETGLGLHFANRTTIDLPSRINTTPTLGLGLLVPSRGGDLVFNLRFYHISNGGTVGDNHGQNQLIFLTGWRF